MHWAFSNPRQVPSLRLTEAAGPAALPLRETLTFMKTPNIENIVVDDANQRTYIVLAPRVLTDGELYKAIRQEILKHGRKHPARGETLTFSVTATASGPNAASRRMKYPANGAAERPKSS